ncbi:MAG: RNA methyltransferase [Casimicrobium sp.]
MVGKSVSQSDTNEPSGALPVSLDFNPLAQVAVVLSHTSHPGNIGAAARAMKTMGLSDLRLVNPREFPSDVATVRATGAVDVLDAARVFSSLNAAIADCVYVVGSSARGRDFVGEVMDARTAATQLAAVAPRGPVAIVFGCETSGLTNDEVALCQTLAYVPTNPDYSSLNLGSAVQVFSYEIRVAAMALKGLTGGYKASELQLATQAEIDAMYEHMRATLTEIGFFRPDHPRKLFPRLQRLFNRTRLEREEVDIFRGMLRAVELATKK